MNTPSLSTPFWSPPDVEASLDATIDHLQNGGVLAYPTETVYGFGVNALDARAVERLYAVKCRPAVNPLIVHVADTEAARALVARWPAAAQRLADAFWPGPVTLVLEKRAHVPDVVTAGLPAVGVRVPAHPVAPASSKAWSAS